MPKLLSWVASFLIICVVWVNHHRIFEQLKIVMHSIFWLNACLLLWCALIPFPTALPGDYTSNPLASVIFGIILALMAFSFSLIRMHVLKNSFVLHDTIQLHQYKSAAKKSLIFAPVLYAAGALCSFIHPYISFAVYFFIPFYYIFYNASKNKKSL